MQVEIDPLSSVPIYQQIRDRVVESIAAGRLSRGDHLLSVRQLAVEFGINVATVSKAYEMLRGEGLVITNHKSGSLVARDPSDSAPVPSFAADWERRARTLVAEAVGRGMPDAMVLERVRGILTGFATERADRVEGIVPPHTAHAQPAPDAADGKPASDDGAPSPSESI